MEDKLRRIAVILAASTGDKQRLNEWKLPRAELQPGKLTALERRGLLPVDHCLDSSQSMPGRCQSKKKERKKKKRKETVSTCSSGGLGISRQT